MTILRPHRTVHHDDLTSRAEVEKGHLSTTVSPRLIFFVVIDRDELRELLRRAVQGNA